MDANVASVEDPPTYRCNNPEVNQYYTCLTGVRTDPNQPSAHESPMVLTLVEGDQTQRGGRRKRGRSTRHLRTTESASRIVDPIVAANGAKLAPLP